MRSRQKQRAAVLALLTCRSLEAASARCGVPLATLKRWRDREDFRALLDAEARRLYGDAEARMRATAGKALTVLRDALDGRCHVARGRLALATLRAIFGERLVIEGETTVGSYVLEAPPKAEDIAAWQAKWNAISTVEGH